MALIGYARVSTGEQELAPQLDALRAAGCAEVFEEHASGASRARPQLAPALARVRRGDTLVVARLDRLARSLAHLLQVVEDLRAKGAHFRSLADPIDTAGPSGVLVLQLLGAVAEFERALIRERTKAGLKAARVRGRVGGNPGLRAGDPEALRRLAASRRAGKLADLLPGLDEWLPVVRKLRPDAPWPAVVERVNAALPRDRRPFTKERLVRSLRLLAAEGLVDKALLAPAPRGSQAGRGGGGGLARERAVEVAAALVSSSPGGMTLAAVGAELARLRHLPPRGGAAWAPSSVKALLARARAQGLLPPAPAPTAAGAHDLGSSVNNRGRL